jgi:hypothetical protein
MRNEPKKAAVLEGKKDFPVKGSLFGSLPIPRTLLFVTLFLGQSFSATGQSDHYMRLGQKADAQTIPDAGIALMGGGSDLDEGFRWLCKKAHGGDFLILRARGGDDYNLYVMDSTLSSVIASSTRLQTGTQDPYEIICVASGFIPAGDRIVVYKKNAAADRMINLLASRLAGIAPPVDGVSTVIDDPDAIERHARYARRFGF